MKIDENIFEVNRNISGRGRYKLNGKALVGVTTILKEQSKHFLQDWAAKEAYTHAIDLSPEEIKQVLKDKSYQHKQKSVDATDKGTLAHSLVEEYINNYIETKTYQRPLVIDEEVAVSVNEFFDWAEKNNVEFTECEGSVYHPKYGYAGSFDFICVVDGKTYLGDFKTSKYFDLTYYGQGAAYIKAKQAISPSEIKFDGTIIVRSTLTGKDITWREGAKLKTSPHFEVHVSEDIEADFGYFMSCYYLYKYNKRYEVREWKELPFAEEDWENNDVPTNPDRY